eukprot:365970-Chlamydomonas_euryale.AAC.12
MENILHSFELQECDKTRLMAVMNGSKADEQSQSQEQGARAGICTSYSRAVARHTTGHLCAMQLGICASYSRTFARHAAAFHAHMHGHAWIPKSQSSSSGAPLHHYAFGALAVRAAGAGPPHAGHPASVRHSAGREAETGAQPAPGRAATTAAPAHPSGPCDNTTHTHAHTHTAMATNAARDLGMMVRWRPDPRLLRRPPAAKSGGCSCRLGGRGGRPPAATATQAPAVVLISGGGSDGGGSTCPAAGSGACITDGGGARLGRAAADSAERHATAGAPEGPLAAPGRPLRQRVHATTVPVSSPEAASAAPSICAHCAGRSSCRRQTGGEGPRRRPQGHMAAAAMGQPCSGAAAALAPQRSGGHWRARPSACWRVPLWVWDVGGRAAAG